VKDKKENRSVNATIISKPSVTGNALDELAKELPVIIAEVMEVAGGNLARLRPEQVSLEFSQASIRDVGSDIRIILFAKNNIPRTSTENERAKSILEKIVTLINKAGKEYSIDIRLYLMEIGAAEFSIKS
jgi:hypothetical protein